MRLAGWGAPEDFYTRPPSLAAARFFGAVNEVGGRVSRERFSTDVGAAGGAGVGGAVDVSCPGVPDGPAVLVVRPEAIGTSGDLPALVAATRFAGSDVLVDATLPGGQALRVRMPLDARVAVGDRLRLELPAERCSVFPTAVPAPDDEEPR